jgi:trans-2,3-dihydro-3-hydroxyanthranilate isomerase
MAAYLWHYRYLDTLNFVAEQGHWMGRPGTVQVSVRGSHEAIQMVQIGGTAVVVAVGTLRI